jgi:predicted ATPase
MPDELPTRTVTLLFTDIEGSTRLLHELGDGYADALAEHRRVLRDAFDRHEGVEVDTQGDAFFVAFASAKDAVAAASEAQQALASGPIRVRMGLHTGEPQLTSEGYVGLAVHEGARIAGCSHGGQVVVSKHTKELAGDGSAFTDLGEHRVKDFSEPVWIFQLGSARFPPLKTISNTNLPRPASSFVGREREVAEVVALLQDGARLVTLSGPGGSGKTRLAIEAAAELVSEYKNGVFWVGLAALRDPALVLETVAQTLGAKDGLAAHVGERELLLLLDNLEQVVEAAPELAALLESCPNLKLLVTSRELLRVSGEVEYPVPPLAEPEAVELFCTRARAESSEDVAELCRRLDHLPLAVELAAGRTSVLSPTQILERLSQRLDLLKGGRDAEARQQTLRATIEWSYDLLSPEEQQLFARLSVFAGGCTLEAAEELADADLDILQSLVDKSLVRFTNERFWMLETIREFAVERFEHLAEATPLRRRLFEYVLVLAQPGDREIEGLAGERVERLEAERDNFRSALAWTLATDPVHCLELAIALGRFWVIRAQVEGHRWLTEALAEAHNASHELRAEGLLWAGSCLFFTSDYAGSAALMEESLALFREIGDDQRVADALDRLSAMQLQLGRVDEGRASAEESLALSERLGNRRRTMYPLTKLAHLEWKEGRHEEARATLERSLTLAREFGDVWWASNCLQGVGEWALEEGDLSRAAEACRESAAMARELGDGYSLACCAGLLACIAAARRDPAAAGRFWGVLEVLELDGQAIDPDERARYSGLVRSVEGPEFIAAVEAMRRVPAGEAVALALDSID